MWSLFRSVPLFLLPAVLCRCSGDPSPAPAPAPATADQVGTGARIPTLVDPSAIVAVTASPTPGRLPAEELDAELRDSNGGRVLLRSLRAHGGWDVWRRARSLRCVLQRTCPGPEEGSAPVDGVETVELAFALDSSSLLPRSLLSAGDEDSYRWMALSAPFSFVRSDLTTEYLGIELDVRSGEELAKIRYSLSGGDVSRFWIAYIDTTSALVTRLLSSDPRSGYRLLVVSDWRREPAGGLVLPSRWEVYGLARLDRHHRRDRPVCNVVVRDVEVALRDAADEAEDTVTSSPDGR